MKTFNDIIFLPHSVMPGKHGIIFFDNGYGVSVVRFFSPFGGYGSYTDNEDEWEVAIVKGDEKSWSITYETPIASDVVGHLKENEVTELMAKVQEL